MPDKASGRAEDEAGAGTSGTRDIRLPSDASVFKVDDERRLVYAWASVARKADGSLPHDSQGDVIDTPEALKAWEDAFYDFIPRAMTADDMHVDFDVAKIVGGLVFTPELVNALGVPEGVLPTAALVVTRIPETPRGDELWQAIKSGQRKMMSIVASVTRESL